MQWLQGQWGRFIRWFPTSHPGAQIGIIVGTLIVACCTISLGFAASPAGQQIVAHGEATSTAQAVANAQATRQAQVYALTHPSPTATATAAATATSAPLATNTDAPTLTPSPTSTPDPTATSRPAPTATPRPQPTATPKPKCSTDGAPPNPWCYTFQNTGKYIYSPPGTFCNYFRCIPSFWKSTNGYVEECQDGEYSHSGGRSGSCSYHGGNLRPLFAP